MKKKHKWHRENKLIVYEHFKGICQECSQKITGKWDVHHFTYNYKPGLYDTPAMILIEEKIITLVCRICHIGIHTASDPNNRKPFENRAACEECGRNERGIFDRKKSQKLDKLLCRKCYLNNKGGVIQLRLF